MIWKIAKKEFLLNLMTFKFAVGTILCLLLTAVFMPILAKAYQERLKIYNENVTYNESELLKVTVYKNITPTIYRPPSALSVFSEGLEKQIGNSATINYYEVPEISASKTNHYLSIFSIFDASLIFKIVISVLALLVAYDAISGERERGTLKLMLSGSSARYQVLLGKLLAGLMVLVVIVTITFILGLVILLSFPMVHLKSADFIRIIFMFFASLIFITLMYNLGLLFSSLARRSAISLVLGLFVWIIFVAVIPNASAYLATQFLPIGSEDKINEQITLLKREIEREISREKKRLNPTYISGSYSQSDASGGGFGHGYMRSCSEAIWNNKTIDNSIEVPIKIKYADKYAEVKFGYLRGLLEQTHFANNLSKISPISLYENVMSAMAGTDMASIRQFIDSVKVYRNDIIEYSREKTNNFSTPIFFTPCTKEEIKTRPTGDNAKPLNLTDLPRFRYQPNFLGTLRRVIPDLALLIFGNVLFFALAFVAFSRYDIR